ncbi:MAG: hypothetical protein ACTHP8_07095 [Bosea sp. (in: a-proteobacteria)]|uniref:hypothetical protein n=1 Tax=Bosea sp. (in: a-proteobacteria) TaxID=1871050 RepID=UPI001AC0E3B0|nr:hypothetical protein [Bosea sp. (in: a-proteobacteria)]MBN9441773.1 hypothetical protein [Bosea sp. (in: a-proteobacteria)]
MSSCLRNLRRDARPPRRQGGAGAGETSLRPSTLILAATVGLALFVLAIRALAALFAGA